MGQNLIHKVLQIDGMTCTSCEIRIENALKKMKGIVEAKVEYSSSKVYITYDFNLTGLDKIIEVIKKLDYTVIDKHGKMDIANSIETKAKIHVPMTINQFLGIGIIILALYLILKNTIGFNYIPQINPNMGYGILFVVGLLTSLHCIAMCGGINLSQCISHRFESGSSKISKMKPSFLYNSGRVISYTIIGGIVGALGSAISFSGTAKGIVAVISGVFMVIMGLNMLNIFPWLRKLTPRMPRIFGNKIYNNKGKNSPFYIGLLNGLMPCGPLQAMQIYALGTGSIIAGATSMLFFSLGTVPLMFGFGAVSSFLSGKFTHRLMKGSAVLVIALGLIMLNRGFNLSGFGFTSVVNAATSASGNVSKIEGNIQVITTTLENGRYTPFIVQKGIPVKWTIQANASDITSCNNELIVPKYGIEKKLVPGDNLIEFTPTEEGNITYTCWMGMISSNIKVVSDVSKVSNDDILQNAQNASSSNLGGGCCSAGAEATKFAGGKIPTDNIQVAKVENGQQEVTVTVNDQGYSPAVVVLQKGVNAKIKFNTEKLNSCNYIVAFPDYQGQLDLSQANQTETPFLTITQDFTFQCGMGMLHGYVKVVDDLSKVNLDEVIKTVEAYKPPQGSGGCGGS